MEDVMSPRHDEATVEKVTKEKDKDDLEVVAPVTVPTSTVKVNEPVMKPTPKVISKPTVVQETPKVTVVKTTKTLEELEKQLEQQKARTPKPDRFDKKKKPFKKRERDDKPATPNIGASPESVNPANFMKIYDDETPVTEETPVAEVEETETDIEDFDEYYEEEK
jgi:hypothetical protein